MRQRLPHFAILAIVGILYLAGTLAPLERTLIDLRFRMLPRAATGDLVVVRIDARSLQELRVWPWPREYHARLVDRLMDAGAREVALDIDFSAASRPEADEALAQALERANGAVILPAFRQLAGAGPRSPEVLDTGPLEPFRRHAQLGAVTVFPDGDGLVRRLSTTTQVADDPLPSMFTLLAGPLYLDGGNFLVDFGIDPDTVPQLSYVDVLNGDVAPEALAGKRVIVGATAVELGDNLAVPVYRTLTGPILQALAYESLVQGRAIGTTGKLPTLLVAALLALLLGPRFSTWTWRRSALVGGGTILAIQALGLGVQGAAPVSVETAPWIAAIVFVFVFGVLRAVEVQAGEIFQQRMAMARRRALMDQVVANSFDGVVITDSNGSVEMSNKAAAQILGCAPGTAWGSGLADLFPPLAGIRQEVSEASSRAPGAAVVRHLGPREFPVQRQDGRHIVIEVIVSESVMQLKGAPRERRTTESRFHTYTFRDVTERTQMREAERNATERAQAASRAKSEFLANMSHELRTPLNAIIGFSDMMTAGVLGPIQPPKYAEYAESISESGRRLLTVINDILEASRADLGRIKLEEDVVHLRGIAQACCDIAAKWNETAQRSFQYEIAPDVPLLRADPRLVQHMILHLLSNAMKFSGWGDRVTLRVHLDADGNPTVEVEDTGIGIAAADIPKVTTLFYQVDGSLSRREEGTGLGLSLVAAYAELHGGALTIDSEPGAGTCVRITFPAGRILAATLDEPQALASAAG